MTILEDSNVLLLRTQHTIYIRDYLTWDKCTAYVIRKLFGKSIELFGHIASMHSV